LIFVKTKPRKEKKKVEQKKAYNFQLKIIQAPGIRQEAKREKREEEHQSRGERA
jgi:hypothetical protein